jgi:hypothetical protein
LASHVSEQKAVEQAKNKLRMTFSQVDYMGAITEPVRQHPLKSVGIAFAAGVWASDASKNGLSSNLVNLLVNTLIKL